MCLRLPPCPGRIYNSHQPTVLWPTYLCCYISASSPLLIMGFLPCVEAGRITPHLEDRRKLFLWPRANLTPDLCWPCSVSTSGSDLCELQLTAALSWARPRSLDRAAPIGSEIGGCLGWFFFTRCRTRSESILISMRSLRVLMSRENICCATLSFSRRECYYPPKGKVRSAPMLPQHT